MNFKHLVLIAAATGSAFAAEQPTMKVGQAITTLRRAEGTLPACDSFARRPSVDRAAASIAALQATLAQQADAESVVSAEQAQQVGQLHAKAQELHAAHAQAHPSLSLGEQLALALLASGRVNFVVMQRPYSQGFNPFAQAGMLPMGPWDLGSAAGAAAAAQDVPDLVDEEGDRVERMVARAGGVASPRGAASPRADSPHPTPRRLSQAGGARSPKSQSPKPAERKDAK